MEVKMEYRKLIDLKKLDNNPRTISSKEFDILVKSIKDNPDYFEARPLLLSDRTGELVIIAGNQRYDAAKALGLEEVPTYLLSGLTEDREREIVIRDNVNNGEWDLEKLASDWSDLDLSSWGLELEGFEESPEEIKEDIAPELDEENEPISKPGEVYQLGPHRLMCGDSTSDEDVSLLMNGDVAALLYTDPPYGVSYHSKKQGSIKNDDLKDTVLYDFLFDAFSAAEPHISETAGVYCWFASSNHIEFRKALEDAGFVYKEELIWNKGMTLGRYDYHYAHEACMYCQRKGKHAKWYGGRDKKTILGMKRREIEDMKKDELIKIFNNLRDESTVWDFDRDKVSTYVHPTQKPITLGANAMRNSSKPGEVVLDLFTGSGSSIIAAEQTGRICYGMELDPKFCDVIRKRYYRFVNKIGIDEDDDGWEDFTPKVEAKNGKEESK